MAVRKFKKGDKVKVLISNIKYGATVALYSNVKKRYGVKFKGATNINYYEENKLEFAECKLSKWF